MNTKEQNILLGNTLIIFRGIPGSGKTTLANLLCDKVCSADDYFLDADGNYWWDASKLGTAHLWCQSEADLAMAKGIHIVGVANTSVRSKDLKPYYDLASKHGYKVASIVVENRHGSTNIHGVPEEVLVKMEEQLKNSIKLR